MAHDAGETCSGAPRGDPREWFLISQTALHGIGEVVRWTLRVLKQLFNRYEQMYRRSLKMTSGGSEYDESSDAHMHVKGQRHGKVRTTILGLGP